MEYKISDKEYEDGCLQGIIQILNDKTRELEAYTFVYDNEFDSLDMIRRTMATWDAPFHNEKMSEYVINHYFDIKIMIAEEVKTFIW